MTELARRGLGLRAWGAWLSGVAFGLSGALLSSLLFPVFLAACWAPWVALAWVLLCREPSSLRAVGFGLAGAIQLSTFGGELCLVTALLGLCLQPPRRAAIRWIALAGLFSALFSAPVLLGSRALLEGTSRGAGFRPEQILSYSAHPVVLAESLLPRLFGDLHTFSSAGLWGQAYHANGFPFFLSLYAGLSLLPLALFGRPRRLWLLAALGVGLALGSHGPLERVLVGTLALFRGPVKFFFLASLSLPLLAGAGLERARGRWPLLVSLAIALPVATLGGLVALEPELGFRALSKVIPTLSRPEAQAVAIRFWPWSFALGSFCCLATGGLLASRFSRLSAIVVAADLLVASVGLNPTLPAERLELRPAVQALVEIMRREPLGRVFSCGLVATPPLAWRADVVLRDRDETPFELERQALAPRTQVFAGLEGAFDEDRAGLGPLGAVLPVGLRNPIHVDRLVRALALANVRWVLSWRPLPESLVGLRAEARIEEVSETLKLYQLAAALPRAYFVAEAVEVRSASEATLALRKIDPRRTVVVETTGPGLARPASRDEARAEAVPRPLELGYRLVSPHEVTVEGATGPGLVVLADGYSKGWRVLDRSGSELPLYRANGRYRAWRTDGGVSRFRLLYDPDWSQPALWALASGVLLAVFVLARRSA